nr:hypothetical protein [Steroidobacter agaridevorans]
MAAVIAADKVLFREIGAGARRDRFLTDVTVGRSFDHALLKQIGRGLLEAPDPRHRLEELEQRFGGSLGRWAGLGRIRHLFVR